MQHLLTLVRYYTHQSIYAYNFGSVSRVESTSANCRMYPPGLNVGIFTDQFTHCNGTQLQLADSDLGSEQYISSDYYEWPASTSTQQLWFLFPTRVHLTTITLHYYSDSDRDLPRLRFYVIPGDFDIWCAPTVVHKYVDVAVLSPGGEPTGRRNVSIKVNFNTK